MKKTEELIKKKCPVCGRPYKPLTVKLVDDPMTLVFPACNCGADKYDKDQKRRTIGHLLYNSNIYKTRWNDDLSDFQWTSAYDTVKKIFYDYLNNLEERVMEGRGIMLFGQKGTGKTRLLCYILIQIMKQLEVPCQYYHTSELYELLKDEWSEQRDRAMERCKGVQVLLIDDIGQSIGGYRVLYGIHGIINHRYERHKCTFVNSMRTIERLEDERYLGGHMMSRLMEMNRMALITSKVDWRDKNDLNGD